MGEVAGLSVTLYDHSVERAILHCICESEDAAEIAFSHCRDDWFSHSQNRLLFDVLRELRADYPLEKISRSDASQAFTNKGQQELLGTFNSLSEDGGNPERVEDYCATLRDLAIKRRVVETAKKAAYTANGQPGEELLASLQANLIGIEKEANLEKAATAGQAARWILEAIARKDKRPGIKTGLPKLDKITAGIREGQYWVIAARPGVGKSSLMVEMARSACKAGHRVLVFSCEMSTKELMTIAMSQESGIPKLDIISAERGDSELEPGDMLILSEVQKRLDRYNLRIYDEPAPTVSQISSKVHREIRHNGIDLVFIDYLQLLRSNRDIENQNDLLTECSTACRVLAKQTGVPIVALSQLSRAPQVRNPARPIPVLSDLRGSGTIEQDAYVVCMLYRDEVYNADTDEAGIMSLIIEKNRDGRTGTIDARWIGETQNVLPL